MKKMEKTDNFINRDEACYAYDLMSLLELDACERLFKFMNLDTKLGPEYEVEIMPELGSKSFETEGEGSVDVALIAKSKSFDYSIVVGVELKMYTRPSSHELRDQLNRYAIMMVDFRAAEQIYASTVLAISVPFGPEEDSRFLSWKSVLEIYADFSGTLHFERIQRAVAHYSEYKSQHHQYNDDELTLPQIEKYDPSKVLWVGWSPRSAAGIAERAILGGRFQVNYSSKKAPSKNYHPREEFLAAVEMKQKLHE